MVHTRASQASQEAGGSRKRGRSPSEAPSEALSQVSKSRKTIAGRLFATADSQIREESRMSLERSPEPLDESSSPPADVQVIVPTKSRGARHSMPAAVPAGAKFKPLRELVAHHQVRIRRRTMEGAMDGVADSEDEDDGTPTFVDLHDLGIDPLQLMTPKRALVVQRHTPLSITRRTSPNIKREEDIAGYQATIETLNDEKAKLLTQLQTVKNALGSLGFGQDDMSGDEICKEIRTAFDDLVAQESVMPLDVTFTGMSNQEILETQADIVRGLLQEIDRYSLALDQTESRLTLTTAEYKGVLGKLAEREERNEAQEALLAKQDTEAKAKIAEIQTLKAEGEELKETIEDLRDEIVELKQQWEDDVHSLEADKEDRLCLMSEELDQEHEYRKIAEAEINKKESEYTSLQIKYGETKTELDNTNEELDDVVDQLREVEAELKQKSNELKEEKKEKKQIEDTFFAMEDKADGFERDIKTLKERIADKDATIKDQADELEEAKTSIKDKDTEINQLKSDVFGQNEALKQKQDFITELETKVNNLDNAVLDLQQEKDKVIDEKNEQLDGFEARVAELETSNEQKDGDIEAMRKENRRLLKSQEELRKQLASRGKDVRMLKDITNQFTDRYEEEITQTRVQLESKQALVQNAKLALTTIGDGAATTTLTQQTEKTVIRKTVGVRDSGYLGDDASVDGEELMLKDGY